MTPPTITYESPSSLTATEIAALLAVPLIGTVASAMPTTTTTLPPVYLDYCAF